MNIAVIGDGGWGTTLAILLNNNGYNTILYGVFADYIRYLNKTRINTKFLPGVKIPKDIYITNDLKASLQTADLIVFAVPSQYARNVLYRIKGALPGGRAVFLNVTKGIENKSLMTMSQLASDVLGKIDIAVLSGPSISHEVSRGMPTIVVAASKDTALANQIQMIFTSATFRVYTSCDVLGVELGGSLKNVIAIAAGMLDGIKMGENTKAGLIARGLAEISRLGVAMGARKDTFYGISGLGDLVTTCMSRYGRNRWFGKELARGKRPKDILKKTKMVVEGIATAKSAYELSKKYRVEMPIAQEVWAVLYKGRSPMNSIQNLMARPPKPED